MQTTINVTKRGNLSVEFLCSTLDLRCAVKNVEGFVSLPANDLYVASTLLPSARVRVAKRYKKL